VQTASEVEIIGRSSRGDKELHVNLSVLDGTDFFTEEIFSALKKGEAEIAVHSLKDLSAAHFFSHNAFAVVDRDDVRDVVFFNRDIIDKIKKGETIILGTCSPRRELMAAQFLEKALPQLHDKINIETKSIRGNIENRLKQLHNKEYDATILATAGLNRLLRSDADAAGIRELISDKKSMLLPLIECAPAPCQGAIVAEAHPDHPEAVELLKLINEKVLFEDAFNEKKIGLRYGTGCLQRFGVSTIKTGEKKTIYAAGISHTGLPFSNWSLLPETDLEGKNIFSSTDNMKSFFYYEWNQGNARIEKPVVFVANYKAVQQHSVKNALINKKIIASGTKTWLALAQQGFWVEGCADGLGFENFLPALQMPLINIQKDDICLLTHEEAAGRWQQKGYHAVAAYKLVPADNRHIRSQIENADFIFWSSFSQFKEYRHACKQDVIHACAGGETGVLIKQQGILPVIFPTIKSFEQWRKYYPRPLTGA
jgi:hydroxymethylbilane synthase